MSSSEVATVRRYYLLKSREAWARGEDSLARTWEGKQSAEPGTDLPEDFPSREALAALRYTKVEDLKGATGGADLAELVTAGLARKEAALVIEALAEL